MKKILTSLRLREDLHREIQGRARREYRTLSNALELTLLEGVRAYQQRETPATSQQSTVLPV